MKIHQKLSHVTKISTVIKNPLNLIKGEAGGLSDKMSNPKRGQVLIKCKQETGDGVGENKEGDDAGETRHVLCDVCGNIYNNENEFKRHIIEVDYGNKSLKYENCELIRGGGPNVHKTEFYTTSVYPDTDDNDLKLGLTIKGISEEFKTAHAKIALLLSTKGKEIKVGQKS